MKLWITLLLMIALYLGFKYINTAIQEDVAMPTNKLVINSQKAALIRLKPLQEFNSISDAPLFNENRQPEQKQIINKVVKPKSRVQPLKVKPIGIALTVDGVLAVLKDLSNGQLLRMKVNDIVHGWTLKAVSNESFTFTKGETEKIINYKNDRR